MSTHEVCISFFFPGVLWANTVFKVYWMNTWTVQPKYVYVSKTLCQLTFFYVVLSVWKSVQGVICNETTQSNSVHSTKDTVIICATVPQFIILVQTHFLRLGLTLQCYTEGQFCLLCSNSISSVHSRQGNTCLHTHVSMCSRVVFYKWSWSRNSAWLGDLTKFLHWIIL